MCYRVTTGTEQGLDEVDFTRSAAAAAQGGNVDKLARILDRNEDQLHSSGTGASSKENAVNCFAVCNLQGPCKGGCGAFF